MTFGVNYLQYEEEPDCREGMKAAIQQTNASLSADRDCLPFPEMGMDIDAIEAYLESEDLEPA